VVAAEETEKAIKKLLLLGAGESGAQSTALSLFFLCISNQDSTHPVPVHLSFHVFVHLIRLIASAQTYHVLTVYQCACHWYM
jgi:hypothetical protein